ncbi:hypothetical protein BCR34DRAFT_607111 [Clohesyomyces aquaticus]|uniref:BZIP domain-containing protein n=1 Tax=Clohesyomyces aquaticus TaxID=1231657 RepID=A0A1Y1YIR8_9PLEO|nr:hypothetical protein BCR34DRAFT_607111 [Clohesyomyces aquaticus]
MTDPKESANDSKDKDSAAYLKRREQVRKAQRTHRERKESYIKQLENEVLQLRTNEAKILQENRTLYSEVGRLKKLLEHHGIPHATSQDYPPTSETSAAPIVSPVSIMSNPHNQQQLHICGTDSRGGGPFYLTESDGSPPSVSSKAPRRKLSFFRSRARSDTESNEDSSTSGQATSSLDQHSTSAANLCLRDMDQTNIGMEFVLSLEAPCLHHTQGDPHEPHLPSGHALTVSAPLLFQNPTQPVNTTSTKFPTWETPSLGLEKLLSLSSNFELTDELTPVQAWQQIRSHPDFAAVEVPSLRKLTEDMLKHVKCYGYADFTTSIPFSTLTLRKSIWLTFLDLVR